MTYKIIILLVTFFLLPHPVFAESLINRIEGVYKHRFQNGLVSGETYESEDILEIVKVAEDAAYLRYDLQFYNGHTCNLYGIAEEKGDALVYTDKSSQNPDSACVLRVSIKNGKLLTEDLSPYDSDRTYGCQSYCGARGGFKDVSFDMKAKRKIRYLKKLKNSEEFKQATSLYEEKKKVKNETTIEKQTDQKQ